jgi:hypothetical protein
VAKKSAKSARSDRQALIDEIRNKQKGSEKRRNFAIVGVCSAVALAILAVAVVPIVKEKLELREFNDKDLASIGAPASACGDVIEKKADGNQSHEQTGTQIQYPYAPPAFGSHWNEAGVAPAPFARKIYTADDRPELESLVHNLEHGYAILWYDDTAAADKDTMNTVRGIARKFSGTSNLRFKFIAAPWTAADQKESEQAAADQGLEAPTWPKGTHIALTHWSAGGNGETDAAKQKGIFQYCSAPSGAALDDFMIKYPYTDSPEPGAM